MSKGATYLLGTLSIVPFATFLFLLFVTPRWAETNHDLALSVDTVVDWISKLSWFLALLIFLGHLYKAKQSMPRETRLLWTVVLFFGNFIAFPFYWYFHIRPSAQVTQ